MKARAAFPLWIVLLALAWQMLAVQAHGHFGQVRSGQIVQAAPDVGAPADEQAPADTAGSCALCRAASTAGPSLLPTTIEIAPVIRAQFVAYVEWAAVFALVDPPRAWRSRAPPVELQA